MRVKRVFAVLAVGVTAVAATLLTATPSFAAITCSGKVSNMTIRANVNVLNGAKCDLESDIIYGSITVQPGGGLQLALSTVHGKITATNPTGFRMAVGSTNVLGVDTVDGNVTVFGTTGESMGPNAICRSRIAGNLSITRTSDPFFSIGGANTPPAPVNQCFPIPGFPHGANFIGGGVTMTNNAAHIDFHWNQVTANVAVNGNTGAGSLTDNTVGGNLSCAGNNPAYAASSNSAVHNTCGG